MKAIFDESKRQSLEGDSNGLFLPAKKSPRVPKEITPELRKSQKRKLKKLEEDEKELLLKKRLENLQKYKIPEDAYSLLHSAKAIGQNLHSVPTVVHVSRPIEVEIQRTDFPIVMMEQEIMEAINYHPTVIICGETGCGKTTQVPQRNALMPKCMPWGMKFIQSSLPS